MAIHIQPLRGLVFIFYLSPTGFTFLQQVSPAVIHIQPLRGLVFIFDLSPTGFTYGYSYSIPRLRDFPSLFLFL
jgi:hypothetical protein